MRFTNLIFDLDGTLVDSLNGIEASINHTIQHCSGAQSFTPIREQIGPPIPAMFRRMWPELTAEELAQRVRIFREHYDEEGFRGSLLYPGVFETLGKLRDAGVTMFVLTNKPAFATNRILEATATRCFFRAVISPDSSTPPFASKIRAAEHLREQHLLEPDETAVVGDGVDDARAAAHCHFAFILARYGYGAAALDGATDGVAGVESFDELLRLQAGR